MLKKLFSRFFIVAMTILLLFLVEVGVTVGLGYFLTYLIILLINEQFAASWGILIVQAISGIVVFDLSRRCSAGDIVEVDLFPAYGEDELTELFEARAAVFGNPARMAGTWLCGVLGSSLDAHIATLAEPIGHTCGTYAHLAKHLAFEVSGTTEHASAQVRRGGIPFDAVELPSLAIKPDIAPALSICGEALDMDADCGGFNLAWAWLSGIRAATLGSTTH